MAFPVAPVRVPSALVGQANGRLDPGILVRIPGARGGPTVVLVEVGARSWRAMTVDAARHGHVLKAAGPTDSYRPYSVQLSIFLDRYRTYNTGSGVSVIWNGRRWWKRKGVAAAARPGTSNHGWGLAVDVGEERDGDTGTERMDPATLAWLLANERRYGFSHEIQSEPWHIRYVAGDSIPTATRVYEASLKPKPPPVADPEDDDVRYIVKGDQSGKWWITDGIVKRYIDDTTEAAVLANSGLAKWNNGSPYVWPQAIVDDFVDIKA